MERMPAPFVFYTQQQLIELTGRRARNLVELLEHVRSVPGASIFYHTHYLYLTQHFVTPRFYNELQRGYRRRSWSGGWPNVWAPLTCSVFCRCAS